LVQEAYVPRAGGKEGPAEGVSSKAAAPAAGESGAPAEA